MRVAKALLILVLAAAVPTLQARAQSPATGPEVEQLVRDFTADPQGVRLPDPARVVTGGRVIPADSVVAGPVAVARGTLQVLGTVRGDAIAIGGDVVVGPGGRVTGDAVSALGRVRLDGGSVDGEIRVLGGTLGAIPGATAASSPVGSTQDALSLAVAWLVVLALIGIGVFVFANSYLDGVTETLETRFGRSLLTGVAAQLALVPALALLLVGLAITVIGVLLIPFAVVAYVLAAAGILTLGFLAAARVTGGAMTRGPSRKLSARGAALRGLLVGLAVYLGLWILAAAFSWAPIVSAVIRVVAGIVTWVAASAGLGAAVLSRAGTRREVTEPVLRAAAAADMAWQTPTPITGVVAARRPTSSAGGAKR